MMRAIRFHAYGALCACILLGGSARVAVGAPSTPMLALVIAIDTYDKLPPLPQCIVAGRNVSAALRDAGFEVTEAINASNGAINAALANWGQKVPPQAFLITYFCGYAVSFNGRAFLVPVSAELASADRITVEGVFAGALANVMNQTDPQAALAFLDVAPAPGKSEAMTAKVLTSVSRSPVTTWLATSQSDPGGPGNVLSNWLRARVVNLRALVERARDQWRDQPGTVFALSGMPSEGLFLRGAPPAEVAALAPGPDVEGQMSDAEKRRVQKRLQAMGLYKGYIDGIFGVLTRDAIRGYQSANDIEPTGRLGVTEATKLLFVETPAVHQ